jgi:hypothetical protein
LILLKNGESGAILILFVFIFMKPKETS